MLTLRHKQPALVDAANEESTAAPAVHLRWAVTHVMIHADDQSVLRANLYEKKTYLYTHSVGAVTFCTLHR